MNSGALEELAVPNCLVCCLTEKLTRHLEYPSYHALMFFRSHIINLQLPKTVKEFKQSCTDHCSGHILCTCYFNFDLCIFFGFPGKFQNMDFNLMFGCQHNYLNVTLIISEYLTATCLQLI